MFFCLPVYKAKILHFRWLFWMIAVGDVTLSYQVLYHPLVSQCVSILLFGMLIVCQALGRKKMALVALIVSPSRY